MHVLVLSEIFQKMANELGIKELIPYMCGILQFCTKKNYIHVNIVYYIRMQYLNQRNILAYLLYFDIQ